MHMHSISSPPPSHPTNRAILNNEILKSNATEMTFAPSFPFGSRRGVHVNKLQLTIFLFQQTKCRPPPLAPINKKKSARMANPFN